MQMMVDPLNAPTAQRPDYNDHPTVIRRCVDFMTVTPSATGYYLGNVMPYLATHYTTPSIDAAGVVTAVNAAGPCSDYAALALEFTSCRVLATVVQVEYIGAATSGSGFVNIVPVANQSIVADTVAANMDEFGANGKLIDGAVYVRRHHGDNLFTGLASVFTNPASHITIAISGGAAIANSVMIRITRIMEFTPSFGKLSFASAVSTPVDMALVHATANIVGPTVQVGTGPSGYSGIVKAGEVIAGMAETAYGLYQNPAARASMGRIAGLLMAP